MKDFNDLIVWKKAHHATLEIYKYTRGFPVEERFGLTSQVRRSAASIAANIAEGCGRGSDGDFGRFLQIAMGSASETEYHVRLAKDLGFLSNETAAHLTNHIHEIKRMLASLIKKLNADR